jgi:hypothetical protein
MGVLVLLIYFFKFSKIRWLTETESSSRVELEPGARSKITLPGNLSAEIFELNAKVTGNIRIYINDRYFWDNASWDHKLPLRMSLNVTSRFFGKKNILVEFENRSKAPAKVEDIGLLYDQDSNVALRMKNSTTDFLYLSDREFIQGDAGNGKGSLDSAALVQRMKALNISSLNYLIFRWTEHEWPRFKNFAEFSKNHGINLGLTVTKTSNLPINEMLEFAQNYPRFKFLMIDDFSYVVKSTKADKRAMRLANQIYHNRPDMSFIPVVYDLGDVKKKAQSLAPYLDAIQWYHRGNAHPDKWFRKSIKRVRSAFKKTPILLGIYDTPHSSENSGESSDEFSFLNQKLAQQYLHGTNRFGLDGGWAGDSYGFRGYFGERHEATRQLQFLKRSGLKNLANGSFDHGSSYWWYNNSSPAQPGFATKKKPKEKHWNISAKSKYVGRFIDDKNEKIFRIHFPSNQSVGEKDWNGAYGGYYGQLSQLVSLPHGHTLGSLSFRYKVDGSPNGHHDLVALVEGKPVWSGTLDSPSPWKTVTVNLPQKAIDRLKLDNTLQLLQLRVSARKSIFGKKNTPLWVDIDDIRLNRSSDPILFSESFDGHISWSIDGLYDLKGDDIRSVSDLAIKLDFSSDPNTNISIEQDLSGYTTAQFQYWFDSNAVDEIWILHPILKQHGSQLYFKNQKIAQLSAKKWHNFRIETSLGKTQIFVDQNLVHDHTKRVSFKGQFGGYGGGASGIAIWDNMQFQNHWRGGVAFTFNRRVFGNSINQNKSDFHGLKDVLPAIIPTGRASYTSKLKSHWKVLQLEKGARATKQVAINAISYKVTFLYRFLDTTTNGILYKSDDGLQLEQRGGYLFLNGENVAHLADTNVWYRLTLHVDKKLGRVEFLKDWESQKVIEEKNLQLNINRLTLGGLLNGQAQWDQMEMFSIE